MLFGIIWYNKFMISTYKYHGTTWIDLESPTEDELLHVISEYKVPENLIDELVKETLLSKVDNYKDMIYLILHFPRIHNEKRMPDLEIDFILGRDFIITVHYEFSNALYDFARNLEVEVMLEKENKNTHAGHLFHSIIIEAYKQAGHKLDDIYQLMEEIKDKIFKGHEDKMVNDISHLSRKILDFKQAMRFHDGVLSSFEKVSVKMYGDEYLSSVESMRAEHRKLVGILDGHREMLLDLRETNDSLLSAKTNKTMRILTIMSFTTFPLTLIATMLAMITHVSVINTVEQYAYIMLVIMLVGILIILHFKKRRWLL
jgi:magnesium transporter